MAFSSLILLIVLFFVTSAVGVVTGSNSLITVPVMFQFGIDERVAVATNMFGLTFMAAGGTIPFVRNGSIQFRRVAPLILLTIVSSAIGAALVGLITGQSIRLIVSVAMLVVAVFILLKPKQLPGEEPPSSTVEISVPETATDKVIPLRLFAYALTFLLGIYGGLYSGGYVTILTVVLASFFGMTFTESIGSTKLINLFSSLVATIVFMWQGLVDYKLGAILAVTMFVGAFFGAHLATRMNEFWLKSIFFTTVFLLAVKTLVDFV